MNFTSPIQAAIKRFDVVDTFGPLAGMHAAMDRLGAGMPCGIVARFENSTTDKVEAAIDAIRHRFPVLDCRLDWQGPRPVFVPRDVGTFGSDRKSGICPMFTASQNGPVWSYCIFQDGADTWLSAVWVHASADGLSMMRFIEAISAKIGGHLPATTCIEPMRRGKAQPMAAWLPRFVFERHLPYVNIARDNRAKPAVAWTRIDRPASAQVLADAHNAVGGFGAWLSAASCMSYCEQQQGRVQGRVSLNLPIANRDLEAVGNFGFGAGSLLMPVALKPGIALAELARSIRQRKCEMVSQHWDRNFDRFLSDDPEKHQRFAGFHARGQVAPSVTVSWKGVHNGLCNSDGIGDVACFASASVAHVSAHADHNGLSISVTTPQSPVRCEALLRDLVARIGGGAVDRVWTLCDIAPV